MSCRDFSKGVTAVRYADIKNQRRRHKRLTLAENKGLLLSGPKSYLNFMDCIFLYMYIGMYKLMLACLQ